MTSKNAPDSGDRRTPQQNGEVKRPLIRRVRKTIEPPRGNTEEPRVSVESTHGNIETPSDQYYHKSPNSVADNFGNSVYEHEVVEAPGPMPPKDAALDLTQLKAMKIAELHEIAHSLHIEGYGGMQRQDLLFNILAKQSETFGYA
ncbi:MAG: Rho termination factor N-terminal domain-containing protein, partial [Calditrichaeota bacterium]|nr:Rho termination factor N-terminal domain-containing protein [Calditrichota bacterium]